MNEVTAHSSDQNEPRASRIDLPHLPGVGTQIWMGGSQSLVGEPVAPADLGDAVVIDCAGDLPHAHRAAARRYIPCVFLDAEREPTSYPRVAALVHELATAIGAAEANADAAPQRIFVFCQYGLNRSGLVTGLLLRALGGSAADVMRGVQLARPGALNNLTFGRLIAEWRCPRDGEAATSASR
ncbi:MAG TPA: hypothetical protein VFD32_11255 [Dehalococcoidia bacterium]|nr:hypothetical protein [Dehalococcoidia bacterium]